MKGARIDFVIESRVVPFSVDDFLLSQVQTRARQAVKGPVHGWNEARAVVQS